MQGSVMTGLCAIYGFRSLLSVGENRRRIVMLIKLEMQGFIYPAKTISTLLNCSKQIAKGSVCSKQYACMHGRLFNTY
ncbi:hypothetical protein VN97_g2708 [Penicillium thymicola]|uniref:Uncharacterized protein n=1 Tax=Penicillium thymicola TaxID=293382 RepID=A0AAI9TP08_PENTH|nr:hypothetical protein VN97_g2708 [Penicillium thymicola]